MTDRSGGAYVLFVCACVCSCVFVYVFAFLCVSVFSCVFSCMSVCIVWSTTDANLPCGRNGSFGLQEVGNVDPPLPDKKSS